MFGGVWHALFEVEHLLQVPIVVLNVLPSLRLNCPIEALPAVSMLPCLQLKHSHTQIFTHVVTHGVAELETTEEWKAMYS